MDSSHEIRLMAIKAAKKFAEKRTGNLSWMAWCFLSEVENAEMLIAERDRLKAEVARLRNGLS